MADTQNALIVTKGANPNWQFPWLNDDGSDADLTGAVVSVFDLDGHDTDDWLDIEVIQLSPAILQLNFAWSDALRVGQKMHFRIKVLDSGGKADTTLPIPVQIK